MARTDHESSPPDVSVVIPTLDRSRLLQLTLRSILRQRDVAFEVIVVDDGSTDDTPEVVHDLRDPRVRLIRHDSAAGVSAARNTGIAHARGEWLAFCDDDDLWAPDKLTHQLEAVRAGERIWGYVGHVDVTLGHRVTGGGPPLHPEALIARLRRSNVVPGGCSGVIARKEEVEEVGGFDAQLAPMADWDLWLRLARLGTPAYVPKPLVAYRVHGDQMSLDAVRMEEEFEILARRYGEGDWAILYEYLGWWALRVRRHREALRLFIRASLLGDRRGRGRRLAGHVVAVGRSVLGPWLPTPVARSTSPARLPKELQAWRAEGQIWIEDLVASFGREAT